MVRKQDKAKSPRRAAPKSAWTSPEVKRLLTGDAENNPGDTHSDGSSTFS